MIAIALYTIISLIMGRKNPMYYMILPFALQQGEAAFINQYIVVGGKSILSPYATVFIDVLFFITLVISFFLIKIRIKRIAWLGSSMIMLFFGYVMCLWVRSFLNYPDTEEVFLTGRQIMYIPCSYFLWIAIFQTVTREQYEQFLKLIFYITPISTLLYIFNSSGIIHIFDETLIYQELDFGTSTFLRDFRTIPLWLLPVLVISIQSIITPTFNISKKLIIANIIILPVGLLFTFTRSLLFAVIIQFVFLVGLYGTRISGKLVGNLLVFILFLSVSLFVIQKVFPNQSAYFQERLISVKEEGKDEGNVNIRLEYLTETIDITSNTNPFIGAGMDRKYYVRMALIGAWIADSTIPYFLMHTGWIGVILLFTIILLFFADSLILFFKTRDWLIGYLCSFFLSLFISALIMGGEMLNGSIWTLMNFALYAVIKYNRWKAAPSAETVITRGRNTYTTLQHPL